MNLKRIRNQVIDSRKSDFENYTYKGDPIEDPENFDKYVSTAKEYIPKFKKLKEEIADVRFEVEPSKDRLVLRGFGDAMSDYDWALTREGEVSIRGQKGMGNWLGGTDGQPNPTDLAGFKEALDEYFIWSNE